MTDDWSTWDAESLRRTEKTLLEFLQLLSTVGSLPQAAHGALKILCKNFGFVSGKIWLLDQESQTLYAKYFCPGTSDGIDGLKFGEGWPGKAWAAGKAVWSTESDGGSTPVLALPMFATNRFLGVIELLGGPNEKSNVSALTLYNCIASQIALFTNSEMMDSLVSELNIQLQDALGKANAEHNETEALKTRLSDASHHAHEAAHFNNRFLNTFSHEIRTPLNGILGISELLSKTDLTPQQTEYINVIRDAGEVLTGLFNDLIDYARRDKQPSELMTIEFDKRVKSESTKRKTKLLVVNGLIGTTEVADAYAIAAGIPCATATRASQALMFLRQAANARDPFSVVLVEPVMPDLDAYEFARLVRNDDSIAMTSLVLVGTFERPAQREKALRAGFDGYCGRIVKQAQLLEELSVVSPEPVTAAIPAVPSAAVISEPIIANRKFQPGKVVLIAEDNPINQKVAALQLRELGYGAHIVANGQEAVDAASRLPYAAILMDLQMPVLDGISATQAIRSYESQLGGRHVPIIAMTAQAEASDRKRCLSAGMDDYLSKPVAADSLKAMIEKWVEKNEVLHFEPERSIQSLEGDMEGQQMSSESIAAGLPPIDVAALQDMLGKEGTEDVLNLFVETTEDLIGKIDHAIQEHDPKTLKEVAHELKGSCASIGAGDMASDCSRLEEAAREGQWERASTLKGGLSEHFQTTRSFIKTLYH